MPPIENQFACAPSVNGRYYSLGDQISCKETKEATSKNSVFASIKFSGVFKRDVPIT